MPTNHFTFFILCMLLLGLVGWTNAAIVLFTFDDGNADIYTYAYPILSAAGYNGTEYVITNFIGQSGHSSLTNLTIEYNSGWDIGSHTDTHTDLTSLTESQQESHLTNASSYLITHGFTRSAYHVAYPYGSYNADTLTAMANTGMLSGRTTDDTAQFVPISSSPYIIKGRKTLDQNTSVSTISSFLNATPADQIIVFFAHKVNADMTDGAISISNFSYIVNLTKSGNHYVTTPSELVDLQKKYGYAVDDIRLKRSGQNESFSMLRNGIGTLPIDSTEVNLNAAYSTNTTIDTFTTMCRVAIRYDTNVGPNASIKYVVITLVSGLMGNEVNTQKTNYIITNYTGLYPFTYGDYVNFTDNLLGTNFTNTSWANYHYAQNSTFYSNQLSYINKTGFTNIYIRGEDDFNNQFSGTWVSGGSKAWYMQFPSIDTAGTSLDPAIMIIYKNVTPDTFSPPGITNLTNDTSTCEQITWIWENPSDSDFNHTMIYRNNTFLKNTSNATISDLWSNLTGSGTYIFSSHTCDLLGNCNETWVNQSTLVETCSHPNNVTEKINTKITDTQNLIVIGALIITSVSIVSVIVGSFGKIK